jgi:hypothetical protein
VGRKHCQEQNDVYWKEKNKIEERKVHPKNLLITLLILVAIK